MAKESDVEMIKNNKISEFLDQYSNELRRMGIYILIIAFIFALGLKVIGDRTKIAPPENRQAEGPYIEVVDFPDPQIPENLTIIVDSPVEASDPIINEEIETSEEKSVETNEEVGQEAIEEVDIEEQSEAITEEEVAEDVNNASSRPLAHSPTLNLKFSSPLQGEIINSYGLTYSKTFGDYRFNPGIDIKAKQGTEVKAALAGQVVKVETNENEKTIIEIEHEPGIISRYSHLEESLVKTGDKVKTSQVIGKVGSPGLAKSGEEPLLHFQIKNGDKWVDPTEYLK